MTTPLLKASQLIEIQRTALRAFTTQATLRRPVFGSDVLGDDATDPNPQVIGTVMGWLTSSPASEPSLDGGNLVTANTHRWSCDVASGIRPRDLLDIGTNTYVVTDTTADETWPAMLNCALRLRE